MNAHREADDGELEALREFIYLMPIGVLRFGDSGAISMLNPTVVRLLQPAIGSAGFGNVFATLATLCPDLKTRVEAFAADTGIIMGWRTIPVPLEGRHVGVSMSVTRVRPGTHMAVFREIPGRRPAGRSVVPAAAPGDAAEGGADDEVAADDALEELRHFIYLMPIGILRFDDGGAVEMLNPMVSQLLMPLIGGRGIDNIFDTLDALVPDLRDRIAAATGFGLVVDQQLLRDPAGAIPLTVSLTVTRVQPGVYMAVLRDVTRVVRMQEETVAASAALRTEMEARRATEQQLAQAQKMEMVGQLTGGLAHDFNNLLSVVILSLEDLHDHLATDETGRGFVEDALQAAFRGAELTQQLLAFARRQPLVAERVDLNAVIDDILRLLRRTLNPKIVIECHPAPGLWPVVIDRVQFESAIANLVTNARDAMPDGGSVTIVSRNVPADRRTDPADSGVAAGDAVAIELRDTGTGMPPAVLERIFEPFFTTKEAGSGSGLGLSMVFGFIKQSGGHVGVESALGRGTRFEILLPAAAPLQAPVAKPAAAAGPARRACVLVVDDNEALRRVVLRQLARAGHRTLEAGDAAAALALIDGDPAPDLLLTDVGLPGPTDGRALARAARARRPALRTLFTSGFDDPSPAGEPRPAGRILRKPYRVQDLLAAIDDALAD